MVTIDEEAGRSLSATPLLVGVHHSTGPSDSKGLTTSESYGATEVDRYTAKVPAESSRSSMNTSRGGKSTDSAILCSHYVE